jgi:hypothetical protein
MSNAAATRNKKIERVSDHRRAKIAEMACLGRSFQQPSMKSST